MHQCINNAWGHRAKMKITQNQVIKHLSEKVISFLRRSQKDLTNLIIGFKHLNKLDQCSIQELLC